MLALAEEFDAWLVVDDAHGFGVLGEGDFGGRGTLAHLGLESDRIVYMGTLGKAAGVAGAFVAAHPAVIETLVQSARSYIYTTAAPPFLAEALRASLRIIAGDHGRRAHLLDLLQRFRERMHALPWALRESRTPIQPLVVGANAAAVELAGALWDRGFWVPAIRPPTVPVGTARLRITLTAAHTRDDVDALVDALADLAPGFASASPPGCPSVRGGGGAGAASGGTRAQRCTSGGGSAARAAARLGDACNVGTVSAARSSANHRVHAVRITIRHAPARGVHDGPGSKPAFACPEPSHGAGVVAGRTVAGRPPTRREPHRPGRDPPRFVVRPTTGATMRTKPVRFAGASASRGSPWSAFTLQPGRRAPRATPELRGRIPARGTVTGGRFRRARPCSEPP
jgi:hypothetical protein